MLTVNNSCRHSFTYAFYFKGESLDKEILTIGGNDGGSHRTPPTYLYNTGSEQSTRSSDQEPSTRNRNPTTEDQLGPLPPNWEKAYTDTGEVYFIEYVFNIPTYRHVIVKQNINVYRAL